MTTQQREAFEARFTPPMACVFTGRHYSPRVSDDAAIQRTDEYNLLWEGWQAAQQVQGEAVAWTWVHMGRHVTVDKELARELIEDGEQVLPLYPHPQPVQQVPTRDDIIQCLLATQNNSEGETADLILGLCYAAFKQEPPNV